MENTTHNWITLAYLVLRYMWFCWAQLAASDGFLLSLLFHSDDLYLRNVGICPNYRELRPRRPYFWHKCTVHVIFCNIIGRRNANSLPQYWQPRSHIPHHFVTNEALATESCQYKYYKCYRLTRLNHIPSLSFSVFKNWSFWKRFASPAPKSIYNLNNSCVPHVRFILIHN
jgi:hypothetical protein